MTLDSRCLWKLDGEVNCKIQDLEAVGGQQCWILKYLVEGAFKLMGTEPAPYLHANRTRLQRLTEVRSNEKSMNHLDTV